ncbi:hypothetical protein AVEN_215083-1 [Araneus ventricosus]|uniref:Uncharacterized protein n=1 Tax=Araneus ventricosus TaxID=182803 RepID=A0A4Y2WZE8_ARAVE|nr:hypothetical protein AVEN_215083-1 [Araneus ventricosus]
MTQTLSHSIAVSRQTGTISDLEPRSSDSNDRLYHHIEVSDKEVRSGLAGTPGWVGRRHSFRTLTKGKWNYRPNGVPEEPRYRISNQRSSDSNDIQSTPCHRRSDKQEMYRISNPMILRFHKGLYHQAIGVSIQKSERYRILESAIL